MPDISRPLCCFYSLVYRWDAWLSKIAIQESSPQPGQQLHFDSKRPVQVFMELPHAQKLPARKVAGFFWIAGELAGHRIAQRRVRQDRLLVQFHGIRRYGLAHLRRTLRMSSLPPQAQGA
jgi:hypothetical protein